MPSSRVYIGIDVACAVNKKLPICVVSAGLALTPLTVPKQFAALIPRGVGNREISAPVPFRSAAQDVANAVHSIARTMEWEIERIAIDAPAAPPATGSRLSETQLGDSGLSSFRTPAASAWPGIREQCANHLSRGGSAANLPHANKIWMLYGFELFRSLKNLTAEIIEVYPFAIVRALLPGCAHKTTEQGYRDQLAAVSARTGWAPLNLEQKLKETVSGTPDDRLDSYMAAWVASLPPERRRAFGDARNQGDSIWVPLGDSAC
jgi:hypothetical protein